MPKIIIIGHGRHGKDTVAMLFLPELSFASSSYVCADKVIFPALKDEHGYISVEECFNDRHNHRGLWFNLIAEYNREDPSRLATEIFKNHDIYVGLRNKKELEAYVAKNPNTIVIWVDASDRLPLEPNDSMTVTIDDANIIIDNNGTEKELINIVYTIKQTLL